MLVRRVARALFAGWFAVEGVQVLREPAAHVARARARWNEIAERFDLPTDADERRTTWLVRAHGGAMALAAIALMIGKAPRTAALTLAGLTAPLVVASAPLSSTGIAQKADRERFVRVLSMFGGALLAAVDNEGRPSLSWQIQRARLDREAARETRAALDAAQHQLRDTIRAAKSAGVELPAG
jgi:uncharacterized membrane protein YphA (DoxX/SURF4 family)